ncbi:non-ribosomal peptide synthase/polyketide synthase [Thalassobaculum sp. OXR-137]|uniref:non-ribosomal peptide synthase/polyketide synthase n=1 Tax=Thalassobaculum sp. OXR-137 TaxID=3100173 RepID=UPI002AC90CAC|nr:non-ribosomal peptide synthase/polyketide synthase [Thalassobaculum sp. OXR-137]WPZ32677.1 non-ribosomal peptide synthase/polyketide synthase [Thalassobaculum sp. OXR-137]
MTIAEFVKSLADRNVELSLSEGQIRYRGPSAALGDEVLAQIRARKPALIDYLSRSGGRAAEQEAGADALSLGQEALWFIYELDRGNLAYNTLYADRLRRDLDIEALRRALRALTRRHDVLRTRFATRGGHPYRDVLSEPVVDLTVTDAMGLDPSGLEAAIAAVGDAPFDLEAAPPARWHLLTGAANGTLPTPVLVVAAHHSIVDFRSLEILLRDLSVLYLAEIGAAQADLPALPWSYGDHVAASRAWVRSDAGRDARAFWMRELDGDLPVLDLPTDRPRPAKQSYVGATLVRDLDADASAAVRAAAQRLGVTPYVLLLGAFGILLQRYSGQREILVGSPMLGRTRPETADLAGYFVNPVVLRLRPGEGIGTSDYLAALRDTVLAALEHQDYPFPLLVEDLKPERDGSRSPLFQVAFVYERERGETLSDQGLFTGMLAGGQRGAVFDITLTVLDRPDGLRLTWEYASALFDDATVARMAGHFEHLLAHLLDRSDGSIDALPLLSEAEAAQIAAWNRTEAPLPRARNLADLIARQVMRDPSAVAVEDGERRLTYGALDIRACRLANHLQDLGVGPNDVVALALPRGTEQMIALLAVLRAGGACLPIDPQDPAERLSFLLVDSGAKVVLADAATADGLPQTAATVVVLAPDARVLNHGNADVPACPAGPDDLVYLLFTSGSTGRPKGVAMPHRAMVNLMTWQKTQPGLSAPARTLQYTALTFDVAFQEIASTWCGGGTLVLIDEERRRDGRALLNWIAAREIERVFMPFVALQHLAESAADGGLPPCLRDVVTAGEQLRITPSIRAAFAGSTCRLHNHYGPTESHVVTAYTLPETPETWEELTPIGAPIANTRIHLLDDSERPVPIGIPGELCIAGAALAQGYLGRPDLTAERFVDHPDHGRLYRTGDVARWRPDGLLAYLGRRDDQVKLRGIRVELGEIEAVLSAHPAVGEAAVATVGSGAALRLAAYVAPADGAATEDALRSDLLAHLRATLPAPLVPGSLTLLPHLPQTASGKIDRRALPKPAPEAEDTDVPPRTEDEALLAALWADVLGLARVGVTASFFDLGGHSLIAMRLIARIRESFATDLPLSALFEDPTVAGMARRIAELRGGETLPPIVARPTADARPLSFAQQRLWFLDRLDGPSATYNMPATLALRGALDVDALRTAACRLVARHGSLRSRFPSRDGAPEARLLEPYDPLTVTDLTDRGDAEEETDRLAERHAAQPFDLAEGPLFRLHLVRLGTADHRLLFNIHHIVSDRWSIDLLVREFAALYRAALSGEAADLPPLEIGFADYAAWQQDWLQGEVLERQLAHWTAELDGAPTQLDLPADRPHPPVRSHAGGLWEHHLDAGLTRRLREVSRSLGATDFMTVLSAFGLLLSRYSGQDDILIGCPVSNRRHTACEGLIGMFVNTLALRWSGGDVPDFAGLVSRIRRRSLRAHAHADLPFELLVDHLQPEREISRSPVFQVMFVMQNAPLERLSFGATEALLMPPPLTASKFDLTLYVEPTDDGLATRWEYSRDIFDEDRIARLSAHFERLLRAALDAPSLPLADLRMSSDEERRRLSAWGRGPAVERPWDTLVDGFRAQVALQPDATALVGRRETLDYATLNRRANRLAHLLAEHGIGRGALVGVCLAPTPQAVVALLAVAKARAAYLPLDPAYPVERLAYMLSESGASLVLSTSDLADRLPGAVPVLALDTIGEALEGRPDTDPAGGPGPDDPLYVIYTSGSTGRPKGAGVTHGGFANLLNWYRRTLDLGPGDRGLLVSALGFDLTQKNLFAPLLCGAALHFPELEIGYDPAALRAAVAKHAITWINCTPSAFYPLLEGPRRSAPAALASLRHVVLGGEPIQRDRLAAWLADPSCHAVVLNSYGPTECTDVAVAGPVDPAADLPAVPLGRPIDNVRLLVVDPADTPQPVGIPGELLIGGAGVGTGYRGRDDLNARHFADLTVDGRRERYYRTGDIVAWRSDGTLDYLGRRDEQVKLRGFRIELGEVEAVLRAQPGVEEAAVVVRRSGAGDHLAAYLTGVDIEDPEALRPALLRQLPAYMVPDTLTVRDRLPLTPNGKLDRRALEALPVASTAADAPMGDTEARLAEIWITLLGLDTVDRNASFFALGGHSLLAVQLVARIADGFGTDIGLRALFEAPTLAGLAAHLDAGRAAAGPALVALPQDDLAEPSFAQQRLMFLDQLEGPSAAYSMPAALELSGGLDVAALRAALSALVERHESLRLAFNFIDGRPIVRRLPGYDPLVLRDLSDRAPEAAERDAARLADDDAALPFDLATGPLFRLTLLRLAAGRHRLLVNLHHIIADGWSVDLLIADLARLYGACLRNATAELPALALTYTDYAAWQRRRLESDALDRQRAFWRDRLGDAPELAALPTDHPRGAVQAHEGGAVPLHIDRECADALRTLARRHDATLFMVLLAAFKLLLFRYSGERDLCVGVPVANRPDSRLEPVVGLFLNTLVVRSAVPRDGTLADLIAGVREATLSAFAHQDLPFEYLVEELRPTRALSHNPLFQVMINLVNTRREEIALEGLSVTRLTPAGDDLVKFDLNLTLTDRADGSLDGALQYNAALFEAETIAFLGACLTALLDRIATRPDTPLAALSVLPDPLPPRRPMPVPTGEPIRFGAIERSIPDHFADRAARHPDRVAIRTPQTALTYGALDRAARSLAAELLDRSAPARVALLVPHDERMAIAMLGCLQAGRCYVPLDPAQPPARLRAILEDVDTDLIVAAGPLADLAADLAAALPAQSGTVIDLDGLDRAPAERLPEVPADAVAYILYTSGSTGRPKGVVQNHRNVRHFIRRYSEALRLRPDDRILQVASYAFDAAVMDIYGALLTGASLYPVDLRNTGLSQAAEWLAEEAVTVIHATPSVFRALTAELDRTAPDLRLPAARLVVLGGEAVTRHDLAAFRARFEPGCLFVNGLGPTESTVTLQFFADHDSALPRFGIPVGYPVKGTGIGLLDDTGAPAELFGEIAIASPYVALGYWRQDSAVFEDDPHRPGSRLYRSGDLARRLPDGTLEVVGRRDQQVKLRGFRVEPGEVEAVLRDHPGLRQAAVLLSTPPGRPDAARLVAYICGTAGPQEALDWCRARLPAYMVPAQAIPVADLPLTITGKLDRAALPAPAESAKGPTDNRPATPQEELLAGLWAEVLGLERVGSGQSFFDLGGHSLLATQLVSRIRQAFDVDIPLRLLFEHPVLAGQAAAIEAARRGTDAPPPPAIVPRADRDSLPLSFAQQRLWFLSQMDRGQLDGSASSAAYNVTAALALDGALDEDALRRALVALTGRHESLRLSLHEQAGEPVLSLRDPFDPLLVEDLSGLDPTDHDAAVQARATEHAAQPFDLENDPLLRLTLLRLSPDRHVLLVNLHHIAADGWSLGVLVRDLGALYAEALGQGPGLAPPALHYADYAAWQRGWLEGAVLERQLGYWRSQLADAPLLLDLPADRKRPAVKTARGAQLAVTIEPDLLARLEALGRSRGATLFMTLLAGFAALLHRQTGESDILVGSPIANRTQRQTEDLVGFFVNTLVLRTAVQRDDPFAELLAQVRATALDAYAHQDLPFETLVSELRPERSLSHTPLFQVMFGLQNAPEENLTLGDLAVRALAPQTGTAKFDLTVSAQVGPAGLTVSWEYSTDLFDRPRIERLARQYVRLLQAVAEAPERAVGRLPLLDADEQARIASWSGGASPYPRDEGLTALFAERVAADPQAVALRWGDRTLTYAELDARSDRLAAYLCDQAADLSGRVIGLCLERGPELIVAMVAVLKARAAYLPLDPDLPDARRRYMVEDAGTALVLTEDTFASGLDGLPCPVLRLDREAEAIAACTASVPAVTTDGSSLAYVMYTSGSTGQPKGVLILQRAVTRLVRDTDYIDIRPHQRIAQAANTAFDAATFEIWGALLNGAALVLLSRDDVLDPDRFARLLRAQTVDILFLTTALFNRLAQIDPAIFAALDSLLFGGEAVDPRPVRAVLAAGGPQRLLHVYGPTECTTFATWHHVTEVPQDAVTVPIGRPLANTTAHILDPDGQPVPVGVAGELHLGGDGLAEGYLGQPELTAAKFVTHETLGRLYRTGDLCRWTEDGAVEFLGRSDHQVKLRGFRIELGEVETALRRCRGVDDAVVLLTGDGEHRRLVGYAAGPGLDADAIRAELRADLPDYMVPSHLIVLPALPLNANGKLDRAALPAPGETSDGPADDRPATPQEDLLAGLWAEVLGLERVGRGQSFFDLGGHSLLATQLVSRIRQAFDVDIPLRLLFEHPALGDQAAAIEAARRGTDAPPPPAIVPRADRDSLPLSFAQQRLWFLSQMDRGQLDGSASSAAYNVTAALALDGTLDEAALRRALVALTGRHESLRLSLHEAAGEPVQSLRDPFDPLVLEDLSALNPADHDAAVDARAAAHAAEPFDLEADPLLRLTLLRLGTEAHVLLVNLHHIAADGWSLGVLVRDLGALYAEALGEGPGLPAPALHYTDYAAWQRGWLEGTVLDRQLGYWRSQLADAPLLLDLPADRKRPAFRSARGAQLAVTIDPDLLARLEALGRARGATLFMTLLAGFAALLHRQTGESDILIGSPIANRTQRQTEDLVGFFVNTLVLRTAVHRDDPFAELLAQIRTTALDAYAHQDLPFETLVSELRPERSLSHTPLFQVLFGLQNAPEEDLTLGDLTVRALAPQTGTAKFDLTVSAQVGPAGLSVSWEYSTDLFDRPRIERLARQYVRLLEAAAQDPEASVGALPLLDADEQARIASWSGGASPYPREESLAALFAERVAAEPQAVALRWDDRTLTYAELDARSDRLAAYLCNQAGDLRSRVIGLCLERGPELIVAMLATVKAGAAYLPLDPELPDARRRYMVEDAGAALVLTEDALAAGLDGLPCPVIRLDRESEAIAACTAAVPAVATDGSGLAYVMYTSGSTGQPKGVLIPQRAVARLVRDTDYIDIRPGHRIAQAANTAFDAATFEIWGALLNGAALVLLSRDDVLDPDRFAALLRAKTVDILFLTTALFNRLAQIDPGVFGGLDTLLFGGEAVDPRPVRAVLAAGGPTRLLHVYGPTECTTFATWHHVTEVPQDAVTVPIGRPLANTTVHILDADGQPVPIGVAGELHLGGDGLAEGYLGQPELTADRFIPHETLGRLYRTGDLCRWTEDGAVAYLGRSDHQIKLRGFRIELGEVETALRRCRGVDDAVVLLTGDGEHRRLVGYAAGPGLDADAIRAELRAELPDYMVPSHLIALDAMPLNPNGKLDRAALPAPDETLDAATDDRPATPQEDLLAGLWAEVLGLERVGRGQSFFDLGGHSLLATQLVSRIRQAFDVDIPLRLLFEHPVLGDQAAAIEAARRGADAPPPPPIVPRADRDSLPLSFAQQRLWFLNQLEPDNPFYNTPLALRLAGRLDAAALEAALALVVDRHEVLRTAFRSRDGAPEQVVLARVDVPLERVDLAALPEADREAEMLERAAAEARTPFADLGRPPLLRARLLRMAAQDHVLLLTFHHIVIDGWSLDVLTRELAEAYCAALEGRPADLPVLAIQYADYAAWQRAWLTGAVLERQLAYWRGQLAEAPPMLALPTDRPRPAVQSFRGASLRFRLDAETRDGLHRLSRAQGATLFMTLLAGFAALLHRVGGQDDLVIGSPIANRQRAETEGLLGFFVNTLALRVRIEDGADFRSLLAQVRRTALDGYAHQDLPFEHLVEEVHPERDLSRNPVFQVMLALQNMPLEPRRIEGLRFSPVHAERRAALFDLVLDIWDRPDGLQGVLEYSRDLFEPDTAARMMDSLATLLRAAARDPSIAIADLPLLEPDQEARILALSTGPTFAHPVDRSYAAAFEAQVAATPARIAAEAEGRRIDYAELNGQANRLARLLRAIGVETGAPLAVLVPRGIDYLAALLGTIKAGAVFLPLDTAYPADRLRYMLEDSGAAVLVAAPDDLATLAAGTIPASLRDAVLIGPASWRPAALPIGIRLHLAAARDGFPATNPPEANVPQDPLYLLYTSGSTGRPKGALVRHDGALNHIYAEFRQLGFGAEDAFLQSAPASSDISVWQCLGPLLAGGRVVFADRETVAAPRALLKLIRDARVSLIELVPVVLEGLLAEAETLDADRRALPDLACAMVTGEAVSVPLVNRWHALWPEIPLVNAYGPTEAADDICQAVLTGPLPEETGTVPIGRPIDNMSVLVLDPTLKLAPIGVPGEICVGGVGVGAGYWRRPELTARAFVANPYAGRTHGDTLYRTGDLGRMRADGTLEFLGRLDGQVKIRGFRVELAEIEAVLARHPQVRDAVVQDYLDAAGERRLAAYLQTRMPRELSADLVRDRVDLWKELHEASYGDTEAAPPDPTFNTIGWDSTFTGEPLSAEEMQECVDNAVARILALNPKSLLEIGCGTGLLMYRLVPHCARYLGTDLSAVAVEQLRDGQGRLAVERLSEAELRQQTADDFHGIPAGSYDTLVLNSVVQYFPTRDYLLAVLREAVARCAEGGSIFVGDVRSLPLLRSYHGAVQHFRAEPGVTPRELARRIEEQVAREQELAVAPAFFLALADRIPRIAGVSIRPKRGTLNNEMTRFRYDVVLRVAGPGADPSADVAWEDWRIRRPDLEAIRDRLMAGEERVALRNVANRRLAQDRALAEWLRDAPEEAGVAPLDAEPTGLDPEDLWRLSDSLPVDVEIYCEPESSLGDFAVILQPAGAPRPDVCRSLLPARFAEDDPFAGLTNEPLAESFTRHLLPQLRAALKASLPDYMVPASFVVLDRFPLLPNGKIDRKALPVPRTAASDTAGGAEPVTETQRVVQRIWAEVLAIDPPGIDRNFFDLGGHSLKATQVLSRLQDRLGKDLTLRDIFRHPTIAELSEALDASESGAGGAPIRRLPNAADYPVSDAQRRLWVLSQMDGGGAYHMADSLRLTGPLEIHALGRAIDTVTSRHESLRTCFVERNGDLRQRVDENATVELVVEDLGGEADPLASARRRALEDGRLGFDLTRAPLLRLRLLRLADDDHVLLFNMHHIVSDGWSMDVLLREIMQVYRAVLSSLPDPLPPLAVQPRDIVAWQAERLAEREAEHRAYWQARLGDLPPPLDLPTDRPRPAVKTYRGGRLRRRLSAEQSAALSAFAKARGVSLFMVTTALLKALMHRVTGENDISLGTPVAGRPHVDLESQIGFFINTLVLRDRLDATESFAGLLDRVRDTAIEAYAHQDYPFDAVVRDLNVPRDPSRNPLFDVMVVVQNTENLRLDLPGLTISSLDVDYGTTQFDQLWSFAEDTEGLRIELRFNRDLFDQASVERLLDCWQTLLAGALAAPETPVGRLPLLTPQDRAALIAPAATAEVPQPLHDSLTAWFEAQAAATPEAIAVTDGAMRITYGALNARANRLARRLRATVPPAEADRTPLIGICLPRSAEMIVAMLAVLKAGAAYLPLDPDAPAARLSFILDDAEAPVLITDPSLADRFAQTGCTLCQIDDDADLPADDENLDLTLRPDDPAYVIYTSGSTGVPKGSVIPHRNVMRLFTATQPWFGFDGADVWTLFHSFAFDFSVWEIWGALLHGGRLVIVPYAVSREPDRFLALLRDEQVTVLNQTPSAFGQLLAADPDQTVPLSLRAVIFGGEALDPTMLRPWFARRGDRTPRLVNMYGITETTVHVTYRPLTAADAEHPASLIGEPIPDLQLHVLDAFLEPVPLGVPGELYVGGAGLAAGYLNRPELTAERFIDNPFVPGKRLYRTGDRVRRRADGELEYLGRLDSQVKIRGFRIELGEITATLNQHPGIRESAALLQGAAEDKSLTAYYVAAADPPPVEDLRRYLQARLPGYMVPARFVALERMPLTVNGKLDRRALPDPASVPTDATGRAPRTEREAQVVDLWRALLALPALGLDDNVFEHGAHSILAVQARGRLEALTGRSIPVVLLFQHPTPASLAAALETPEAATEPDATADRAARRRKASGKRRRLPQPTAGE